MPHYDIAVIGAGQGGHGRVVSWGRGGGPGGHGWGRDSCTRLGGRRHDGGYHRGGQRRGVRDCGHWGLCSRRNGHGGRRTPAASQRDKANESNWNSHHIGSLALVRLLKYISSMDPARDSASGSNYCPSP